MPIQNALISHLPWLHPTGLLLLSGSWAVFKGITSRISNEKAIRWDFRDDPATSDAIISKVSKFELSTLMPIIITITISTIYITNDKIYGIFNGLIPSTWHPALKAMAWIVAFSVLGFLVRIPLAKIAKTSETGTKERIYKLSILLAAEIAITAPFLYRWISSSLPTTWHMWIFIVFLFIFSLASIYFIKEFWGQNQRKITEHMLRITVMVDSFYYMTLLYAVVVYFFGHS
ncbi:hypothetical protein [Komagataeibacter saccharivorans]|uniref:hypothetical protein n=1 Tax=Komagataeibacter saccharivorans TaxID=265959 RepID=UPI0011B81866|nr:hypothetical protein [Komagataeibacter saccharivorans]GBQ42090.1 hypothetical protein AA0614_2538 [Komagataeibacter saccharivorans NRIC 0614]